MSKELLNKAGRLLVCVAFGPVTEGIIARRKLDKNSPVLHVLVETKTDGLKHIIMPKSLGFYFQPGKYFQVRTRGTGYLPLPWRRIEKDPFDLESKRPKTPLSDNIKRILDSANIKDL